MAVLILTWLALGADEPIRPRKADITVSAKSGSEPVAVVDGDEWVISAEGEWNDGKGKAFGPDGYEAATGAGFSPSVRRQGDLVAFIRAGKAQTMNRVGKSTTLKITETGTMLLGMNTPAKPDERSGELSVKLRRRTSGKD